VATKYFKCLKIPYINSFLLLVSPKNIEKYDNAINEKMKYQF